MNQSIYTERENILPHHAEWLDVCRATWAYGDVSFVKYKQVTDLTIFNGWLNIFKQGVHIISLKANTPTSLQELNSVNVWRKY